MQLFCVIIFGWKGTKLELMTLKVPQLIYLGRFSNHIWSTRKHRIVYQRKPAKEKGWKPLPKNWVRFNAAIREYKTTIAVITINEKGKLLSTYTKQLETSNPLLGEAKAALCVVKRVVL